MGLPDRTRVVTALSAAALAAWIYLALLHGRFWRVAPLLEPAPKPGRDPAELRIAAVIPARNEASTVGATVRSLLSQQWRGTLHIWVVDDSSTDGTAEAALSAGGDRVTVVPAGPLPPGWTGKVWAMAQGVAACRDFRPDYFLLTDADIVHGPGSVAELASRAESGRLDLASIMVRLHCESAAEKALIPAFVFFFFMLYPPAWVRNPRRRTAGAAGGCILLRREALARIGGLESIRAELIDDCSLARRVKDSGGSLWLGLSRETRSIREYPREADIRRMIARTAYTQLGYSPWLLAGTLAGMTLLYGVPVATAAAGHATGWVAWALLAACFLPLLRFYGRSALWAPALPLIAAFYTAATVESAVRYWTGRGGAWKGRNQAPAAS